MINLKLSAKEKEGLTDDMKELAMVRKLQLMTAPYLKRNSKFFLEGSNVPQKAKAYNTPLSKEKFEEDLKNGKVTAAICDNLCKLSVKMLQENGLNAQTISCDTDIFRHIDILLTTKSRNQYIINILEDLDLIQAFMKTPNFASRDYYDIRYKKFENNGGITTNGNRISNIKFIDSSELLQIDKNLGYVDKNGGLYQDDIYESLKHKLSNFKQLLLQGEYLKIDATIDEMMKNEPLEKVKQRKSDIMRVMQENIENMSDEEILAKKLEWIFTYCNDRMNIKGHTDFVMYYSKSLLKKILTPEEYKKLTRYDAFTYEEELPKETKLKQVLDYEKQDYDGKLRFSVINCNDKNYIISTKPDSFIVVSNSELNQFKKFCHINKVDPPSQLAINLSFKGHALPLVFHTIGGQLINKKQESLSLDNYSEEEQKRIIEQTAQEIETTDYPITSILIPYGDKRQYIYLDEYNNFIVEEDGKKIIYDYNTRTDEFTTRIIQDREEK